eukprot:193902-Pelagomonas_calceolata.AAC.2
MSWAPWWGPTCWSKLQCLLFLFVCVVGPFLSLMQAAGLGKPLSELAEVQPDTRLYPLVPEKLVLCQYLLEIITWHFLVVAPPASCIRLYVAAFAAGRRDEKNWAVHCKTAGLDNATNL